MRLDLNFRFEHCFHVQVDEAVFLWDSCSLCWSSRTRGSEQDDSWGSPWRCAPESDSKHLGKIVSNNINWRSLRTVIFINKPFESVLHSLNMEVVFLDSLVNDFSEFVSEVTSAVIGHCFLNGFLRCFVVSFEQNKLVRDDSDLLQTHGLDLSPREPLDNPAFVFFFVLEDLALDQVNDDFIWDVAVVFLAFCDGLSHFALLRHLFF